MPIAGSPCLHTQGITHASLQMLEPVFQEANSLSENRDLWGNVLFRTCQALSENCHPVSPAQVLTDFH